MNKYESSNDVASLAAQYTEFASKYADVESKFDALENDDLNDAETTYYIEVQTRINNKLLEINQQQNNKLIRSGLLSIGALFYCKYFLYDAKNTCHVMKNSI